MPVTYGLHTAPQQVGWEDLLRVWREADAIEAIDHAWLFDHLLPIGGDPNGTTLEGWTALAALAAQTERLGLGVLVTSNRFRPPAVLAKIAATVDVIAGGRLTLGLGVGSRPGFTREYDAFGLPFAAPKEAAESLDEACTIIRRLWTEDEPFDFDGAHHQLSGALCNPKPVGAAPLLIGGLSTPTLRVCARHADLWNVPGPPHNELSELERRWSMLQEACEQVGRDPLAIERSATVRVDPADLPRTLDHVLAVREAGFTHIVLGLPAPFAPGIAEAVADGVIVPARAQAPS